MAPSLIDEERWRARGREEETRSFVTKPRRPITAPKIARGRRCEGAVAHVVREPAHNTAAQTHDTAISLPTQWHTGGAFSVVWFGWWQQKKVTPNLLPNFNFESIVG